MRALACLLGLVALATPGSAGAQTLHTCPHARGAVTYERGGKAQLFSFAACIDRVTRAPRRPATNGLRSAQGRVATIGAVPSEQSIEVDGKPVLQVHENRSKVPGGVPGPLGLVMWSPDGKWLFYVIDPDGSSSIAADGLVLRALDVATGHSVAVAKTISAGDYTTWCGSKLVIVAGGNRLATWNKRLVVATAPSWKPRVLWNAPARAFGSVACAPDGRSVAVLSQTAQHTNWNFFATRWQLWQVTLGGRHWLLDAPRRGYADESPAWSPGGDSVAFVRERNGHGSLMLAHGGRVYGPFAALGYSLGYYGHHDWNVQWQS